MRLRIGLLALALLLPGCGGEGVDGFVIAMRFISIDPAAIDRVRLSFRPDTGERFAAQEEMTYEDGAITVSVEPDGVLIMLIDGEHVRANATTPDGSSAVYELEIYSDDPAMNAGPLVIGSAIRGAEFIGQGQVYLPEWPPPPEARTQLAIECGLEAISAGLCSP